MCVRIGKHNYDVRFYDLFILLVCILSDPPNYSFLLILQRRLQYFFWWRQFSIFINQFLISFPVTMTFKVVTIFLKMLLKNVSRSYSFDRNWSRIHGKGFYYELNFIHMNVHLSGHTFRWFFEIHIFINYRNWVRLCFLKLLLI